ncbi:bifunctional adenosylcobinamide kinase/adenosylcobinamide-phosphate guanylyltransferase [Pseudalkalibacillus hwajinpoensis]|uniref:bifunctional adenosylcobinamide kinase/adenosylcobinamide-phosphate guanylyltransferase n=1 Tax=Guptibacillus hwajinpoensis TaxID=208199 RepID=UPI00325ADC97
MALIFITGGVRSGKSSFAEKRATELAGAHGKSLSYIACGQPSDPEMMSRIEHHKHQRDANSVPWETVEAQVDIGATVPNMNSDAIVLLDCLTTLLSNELFSDGDWSESSFQNRVKETIQHDISKIEKNCSTLIIVSNELGHEPLKSELVHVYARLLGELHQWIVKDADEAYLVEAGIPLRKKGEVSE